MEDNSKLDLSALDTSIVDIAQQVVEEDDMNKTKDLVALFNWNMSKKNVARLLKLNNLFDAVSDQMVERFMKKPDQFSNSDLIDYMKTIQGAIDNSSKVLSQTEEPPVIIQNNTQINVNMSDKFDRESKARIAAAVESILKSAAAPVEDVSFEDKTEQPEEKLNTSEVN